jgi:hypothetical protein
LWISNDEGIMLSNEVKQHIYKLQNPLAKKVLGVMIKRVKSCHTLSKFFAKSTIQLWRDLEKNCVRPKTRRVRIPLSYFMFRSDYVEEGDKSEDDEEEFI